MIFWLWTRPWNVWRLTTSGSAQVVECRYFAGLTEEETAEVLGVTTRTVQRDWAKARAWLYLELREK
jgi:DNA-directed RNA polymerase specialized sigma24 family protein